MECFCAFCRSPRKRPPRRHVGFVHLLASAVASTTLTLLIWHEIRGPIFSLFIVCVAIGEAFLSLKWRLSLRCPHCGFDPVLYKNDPQKASEVVRAHLERRERNPMILFSSRPNLNLPARKVRPPSAALKSTSPPPSILSKTV